LRRRSRAERRAQRAARSEARSLAQHEDAAQPSAHLSTLRRHEPAPCGSRLREDGRLRPPDPPRALLVRNRRPRRPEGLRRRRSVAREVVRGALLGRRLPGRDHHHRHVAGRAGEGGPHGADRARRGALGRRGRGEGLRASVALVVAAMLAACARPAAPPAPLAPVPPPLSEEPLPPSGTATFEIGPIKQTPSPDGRVLFVEGSVRNTGSRPSTDLKVWVSGLDADGTSVVRTEALPTPQAVPPGTEATFVVKLPNDPAIRTVDVQA